MLLRLQRKLTMDLIKAGYVATETGVPGGTIDHFPEHSRIVAF